MTIKIFRRRWNKCINLFNEYWCLNKYMKTSTHFQNQPLWTPSRLHHDPSASSPCFSEQQPVPRKRPHATLQERLWLWGYKTTQTSLCKANWSLQESKPDARLISVGLWITEPTGHCCSTEWSDSLLAWKNLPHPPQGPWLPSGEDRWETAVLQDPCPSRSRK